jgi:hypothetical protein
MKSCWLRDRLHLGVVGFILALGCSEPAAPKPESVSAARAPAEPARLPSSLLDTSPLPSIQGAPQSDPPEVSQVHYAPAADETSPCYGHAPNYSWLTGTLHYAAVRKVWRLRYAAAEEQDPYGGSVTLIMLKSMPASRSGHCVRVEGRLIRWQGPDPSPGYRVQRLQLLDQADSPAVQRSTHSASGGL